MSLSTQCSRDDTVVAPVVHLSLSLANLLQWRVTAPLSRLTRPSLRTSSSLLTVLPLTPACFAFLLRWHGRLNHPVTRWSPDRLEFPGMDNDGGSKVPLRSSRASFPHYHDWKFNLGSEMRPQIYITTSTSAGPEQTLPWIFYHRVIGVSTFFLFVEGKAASPEVSKVLESIPVIVQELRESGVFSSVIASAQTTLSRDKSVSIERSNSSRKLESGDVAPQDVSGSDRDQPHGRAEPREAEAKAKASVDEDRPLELPINVEVARDQVEVREVALRKRRRERKLSRELPWRNLASLSAKRREEKKRVFGSCATLPLNLALEPRRIHTRHGS
ncbi:hypothetical protein NL676_016967 [Syzygium grande]|nr:hypothetical protein NL676_016967 [Syzygium grande]